ncbi:PREDICTED: kinesin-like protein KIF19 [Fragaria vesca subsp. vesca]|uniref:kinesin-like protein KIF19 n=1 Tax=Fragaria vesca subsp. vesca TaxID=101020 RepID=UPI0002C2DD53|nr:PREDICTED: kinesin-like protein KIF19 [Fragaria vesca subsp. vesca]
MPVSTRSQSERKPRSDYQEQTQTHLNNHLLLRNPHHGLKEKMKALTLLYEQQKQASAALRNPSELRFATQKNESELRPGNTRVVMRENNNNSSSTVTRTYVLPQLQAHHHDAKENAAVAGAITTDRILSFATSNPRKARPPTVARRLSLGGGQVCQAAAPVTEMEEVQESETKFGASETKYGVSETKRVGSGGSRIMVYVRLRPMSKKEKEGGSRCCVRIVNRRDVYLTEFANENDYLRLKRLRGRHFTFDASFPDSASQQEVYSTSTAELVEAVLQGRNGAVFCYGATGAGKTYTMLGTLESPGVMVLAIKDVFTKIRQRSWDGNHVVHLSYLEVYNETVRDLLSPGRPLVLREDKQGIVAAGLTQYRAYSTDEVMQLLQRGNQNRTTEPTRCNETSSRSHAILQVVVEYQVKDASMNVVNRVGKLSLIDLAGSERALATEQRTVRSIEGANINRSLLALSSCINALVEGKKHIPFRNSKLTQLLKDSLGGACNTVMIANISPCNLSFGETQNTLHWADRAKEIRTKACEVNEEITEVPESETDQAKLLLELQKENRELRVQLARHQQKLLVVQAQSLAANASPTPSSATSLLTPPTSAQSNEKRKPRPSFLAGNCFTPDLKRRVDQEGVRELQKTVKALEAQIERMKKDHTSQLKQKDDLIRDLSRKSEQTPAPAAGREGTKRVVTRASLRRKEPSTGELKSPSHRFRSPVPTAKKRSFWDITTANSPSVTTQNGRKTRSHVIREPAAAPSMLLQPGFARPKAERLK